MATKKKRVGYAAQRFDILKSITDDARKLRAKNPAMKWTDAVKKAGEAYRKKPVAKSAVKKAAPKKAAPKKAAPKKAATKKAVRGVGAKSPVKKYIHNIAKDNFADDMKNIQHFYNNPQKDKDSQIGIYAGLCKREELYKQQLANYRIAARRDSTNYSKSQVVYYERMLAAIRQQKAIQKKLI